ncbi:hypothetical protein V6N13_022943 [Hibiscus sabdariffa]
MIIVKCDHDEEQHSRQVTCSEEGKSNEPVTLKSLMEAIQGLNRRLEIHERVVQKITTKQNVTQEQVHARWNDEEETENILFVSNDAPIFLTQDDHPTTNTYEGTPQSKDENEIPCNEKKNDSDDPNEKELVKHIVEGDSTQGSFKMHSFSGYVDKFLLLIGSDLRTNPFEERGNDTCVGGLK